MKNYSEVGTGELDSDDGDYELWAKQFQDGLRAVVLFNGSTAESNITVHRTEIGYPNHLQANVRDLWLKKGLGRFKNVFSAKVPSHGVAMEKIMPE